MRIDNRFVREKCRVEEQEDRIRKSGAVQARNQPFGGNKIQRVSSTGAAVSDGISKPTR